MKRFAIIFFLLCVFLPEYSTGTTKAWYDRDQIRTQSIQRIIDTNTSFDSARIHYQELIQAAGTEGDESLQAECLFQVALIYYWQSQYSMSLAEAKKGLAIAYRLNDKELLAVGYDLLGRLHYLFSPEQSQYYYRKCWQYSEELDSLDIIVGNLNCYNIIRNEREVLLDDMLSIDFRRLNSLSQARLGYLIARSLLADHHVDEALKYLKYTQEYLQEHKGINLLNAMYEQLLAQVALIRGDMQQARIYLEKSMRFARENNILMGVVDNYRLASEIAQAQGLEVEALDYYKKSVMLRDSIFNSASNQSFPDDLIYTMMEQVADNETLAETKKQLLIGILLVLIVVAGGMFYYFKSSLYQKRTANSITHIKTHSSNGFHSKMKSHLMKIMYAYKAGVSYGLKHIFETQWQPGRPEPVDLFAVFEKNMQKADNLMDALIERVEAESEMILQKEKFDVKEVIDQLVALYKIGFASKSITYHVPDDQLLVVCGDRFLLAIAMEHLFFRTVNIAAKDASIRISVATDAGDAVVFSIVDPGNREQTLEKEIFAQRIAQLEATKNVTWTADWDFNIFAECTVRNHAGSRIEYTLEKGTTYYYRFPVSDFPMDEDQTL